MVKQEKVETACFIADTPVENPTYNRLSVALCHWQADWMICPMSQARPAAAVKSRSDRKQQTRRRILDAALHLVEEGRSPDALGLREVARVAGMAAPSIYNHFADMESLGLALVDDCCIRLRAIARSTRQDMGAADVRQALKNLLNQFLQSVNRHEAILRLLMMQWFNPNPAYRRTIRRELAAMQDDLADSMRQVAAEKGLAANVYSLEAQAVLALLIVYVLDVMDMNQEQRQWHLARLEQQLFMLVLGSRALVGTPLPEGIS